MSYCFGLAGNCRLRKELADAFFAAHIKATLVGGVTREFREFDYRTLDSWSRARRIIVCRVSLRLASGFALVDVFKKATQALRNLALESAPAECRVRLCSGALHSEIPAIAKRVEDGVCPKTAFLARKIGKMPRPSRFESDAVTVADLINQSLA